VTDRYQQLLLLLRSLHDYDVTLPTSTGNIVRRQAKAGEGPTTKLECGDCRGEGGRRIRGVESPCEACGGQWLGKGKYVPGRGWNHVDAYTERKVGSAETELVSPSKRVRCDACDRGSVTAGPWRGENNKCLLCNGAGEVDAMLLHRVFVITEGRSSGDPRLDAIERRKEAGSYDELLIALGTLRAWPDRLRNGPYLVPALLAYRAVTVLEQDNRTLDQLRYDVIVMAAFTFLEPRMPAEIRVPRAAFISDRRLRESARKANRKLAA
jgi:hypothetical protein